MDFFRITIDRSQRDGLVVISPDFVVIRSSDLMIRGGAFYAVWDRDAGLWSTDEYDVQRLVDRELVNTKNEYESKHPDARIQVKYLATYSSGMWAKFQAYLKNLGDSYDLLDAELTFADETPKKTDHISKRLSYSLSDGPCEAWDELVGTLYLPSEREKLEWAIGSVIAGDAKDIQKFIVIYGPGGAGKSTVLNVVQSLFDGYYSVFEAKELTSGANNFATEPFKNNPLVAIDHDGDLSKIRDITKLNSIVSHEQIVVNEKFKSTYSMRFNAFLFMGTNSVVKITDSRAGLIRRLIDVHTSGARLTPDRYDILVSQIRFELGSIANHCLKVYRSKGKLYYNHYRPLIMIAASDYFYNFVEEYYVDFRDAPYVTLTRAFDLYKKFAEESGYEYRLPKPKFRTELMGYFDIFKTVDRVEEGRQIRSVYRDFKTDLFDSMTTEKPSSINLVLDSTESIFDERFADCPAQYADERTGIPLKKWVNVTTTLRDLDTTRLHYVQVPVNHIVIDMDLRNDQGEKDQEVNFQEASRWPHTYAEFSQSGKALHLHYDYDGDAEELSRIYSPGIEVKVSVGDAAIRRKLTKCNNIPIAVISDGLPKKEKSMINFDRVQSEKGLRNLIERNLSKDIHPGTKPSIDFIHKILDDAYDGDLVFDLTDMRPVILKFAMNSTNQSDYCVKLVGQMRFKSEDPIEEMSEEDPPEDTLVFFDVEVFPNLFLVCWKYNGDGCAPVRMFNPSPEDIEGLLKYPLVGFNNRRYDNHILYARYLGYSESELFHLSSKIVSNSANGYFREAFDISYADVYDFSTKKQSLKMFEIELGLKHNELDIPWDEPVPENLWDKVAEYCDDDVIATEAAFYDRYGDFVARKILSKLSGLSVNSTTKYHTARIIFGIDNTYKDEFVYTDLSIDFPGYMFEGGRSTYRGEDPGEGGYVYAEPGIYENVALLDVASMHPTSIRELNLFGKYTKAFSNLMDARLAIKHRDIDRVKEVYDGRLIPYLNDDLLDDLAHALKIAINTVYGLTSARFDNPFRDNRNVDNIVAKRGALFMIDLKLALQELNIPVYHIKTDSVKVPSDPKIIKFVVDFGEKYGYTFEHEETYSRFALVNNAVYVARKESGEWTATGSEFIHPYVFKTLFSKNDVVFDDLCETKAVTGDSRIYLDLNEGLADVSDYEQELNTRETNQRSKTSKRLNISMKDYSDEDLREIISSGHNYQFVGKVGSFYPVLEGSGGGVLYRVKNGKYYAVSGTKGWRWLERDMVRELNLQDRIDPAYHSQLVSNVVDHLGEFGDVMGFLNE